MAKHFPKGKEHTGGPSGQFCASQLQKGSSTTQSHERDIRVSAFEGPLAPWEWGIHERACAVAIPHTSNPATGWHWGCLREAQTSDGVKCSKSWSGRCYCSFGFRLFLSLSLLDGGLETSSPLGSVSSLFSVLSSWGSGDKQVFRSSSVFPLEFCALCSLCGFGCSPVLCVP